MADDDSRTRVFMSYSRQDMDVAVELRDRLIEARFDAYLDVQDIVKGEPWQERLSGLIERTDTMVFLISPASVASDICNWEFNGAEIQEKRIFPVVVKDTPTSDIPQRLQRLNFTFLNTPEKWDSEFPLLVSALSEDITWTREHTRVGELALRWERAGRPGRVLLVGAGLSAAGQWCGQRPNTAPQLSALHNKWLSRSRAGALHRTQISAARMAVLTVCAIGLSTFAYWQRTLAVRNGEIAERRAATLATDVALARADQGAFNEGLLMLLDAATR